MPQSDSPNWNRKEGVCTKHHIPQVPCPKCLQEGDEDIVFTFDEAEYDSLLYDSLNEEDLLPQDYLEAIMKKTE